jgi:hypothetical protein
LKEKSLAPYVKALVGDVKNLGELWDTLDTFKTDQRSTQQKPP